jgi:hypothetical protein
MPNPVYQVEKHADRRVFRNCLNLYRQVFKEQKIECLFIFKRRIAGYATAKKKETYIFEHKKRRNIQLL